MQSIFLLELPGTIFSCEFCLKVIPNSQPMTALLQRPNVSESLTSDVGTEGWLNAAQLGLRSTPPLPAVKSYFLTDICQLKLAEAIHRSITYKEMAELSRGRPSTTGPS